MFFFNNDHNLQKSLQRNQINNTMKFALHERLEI